MQTDLRECYRILDVEPGVPLEDVKRSYRELVKVWHPDRFSHDPKLQRKAQEKLKQINSAYERICAGGPIPQPSGQNKPSGSGTSARSEATPQPPRPGPAPAQESNWKRRFAQIGIAVVVIAVLRTVFSTRDSSQPRSVRNQSSHSEPRPTYQAPQPLRVWAQPKVRQHRSITQISELDQERLKQQLGRGMTFQEFSRNAQEKLPDYDSSRGISHRPPPEAPRPTPERAAPSIGSEKSVASAPVVSVTHKPMGVHDTVAKVEGNKIEQAREVDPPTQHRSAADFFKVGSTREEVLAIHGEPTRFSDLFLQYGNSMVWFDRGRVRNWDNRDVVLKAKYLTATDPTAKEYFTVGSTREEVLAIHGEPTRFSDLFLQYGNSMVWFDRDRVRNWDNRDVKLKAKYLTATDLTAKEYFTVGSTREEVLAIHGEPTRFSDLFLQYGNSMVWFDRDRVRNWDNRDVKLKAKFLSGK